MRKVVASCTYSVHAMCSRGTADADANEHAKILDCHPLGRELASAWGQLTDLKK
jgi:hypothetical protein